MHSKILPRLRNLFIAVALFGAVFASSAITMHAQDNGAPAAVDTLDMETDTSLLDLYKAGGWSMHVLLVLSIVMFGLTIYNAIMIREKPFLHPEVTEEMKPVLAELHIEQAKTMCDEHPTVVNNIFYAGLERIEGDHFDPVAIEKAMEEASTEELAAPFVLVNYINVVAATSPMVGLLGTVSGMIKAFNAIKEHGMGKPEILAEHISEALITTATGLIIAIPALFSYFYFKNKYGKLASRVSRSVGDLYFTMIHAVHRQGDGTDHVSHD